MDLVSCKIGFRARLVVAAALLVLWTLARVECTTTEPIPDGQMLAMMSHGAGR